MDANSLEAKEKVSASRKLGREEAIAMLKASSKLLVAKGKKVTKFATAGKATDETIAAMLGPTGNLRAPTLRVGKTILVGFEEAMFRSVFG